MPSLAILALAHSRIHLLLNVLASERSERDTLRSVHSRFAIYFRASERSERSEHTVVLSLTFFVYSVTKILRKIRATTFTENYGKLRVNGDECRWMNEPRFQLVLVILFLDGYWRLELLKSELFLHTSKNQFFPVNLINAVK